MATDPFANFGWTSIEIQSNRSKFFERDRNGLLGLHLAIKTNVELAALKEIVEINPDALRERDKFGCLPIHYAANNRKILFEVLDYIVSQSPRALRERDGLGQLPIHAFSNHNQDLRVFEMVEKYYPESMREKDKDGWLPLHHAAKGNKNAEVLRFLVIRYAGALREATQFGSLPIHVAAHFNTEVSVLEYLVQQHPGGLSEGGANGMLPLHSTARNNPSLAVLRFLMQQYPLSLTQSDKQGRTVLHHAVRNPTHAQAVVQELLQNVPASLLSQPDQLGWTPFFHAARYGRDNLTLPLLQQLLALAPQSVQHRDVDGWLILHHVAKSNSNQLQLLQFLVDIYPDGVSTANMEQFPHDLAPAHSDARTFLALFHTALQTDGRNAPMDTLRVHVLGDLGAGKSLLSHWLAKLLPADALTVDLFDETHDIPWKYGRTQGLEMNHVTLKLSDRVTHYLIHDYSGRASHLAAHTQYLTTHTAESVYLLVLPLWDKSSNRRNSAKTLWQRLWYWTRLLFSRVKPVQGPGGVEGLRLMVVLNVFVSEKAVATSELRSIKRYLLQQWRKYYRVKPLGADSVEDTVLWQGEDDEDDVQIASGAAKFSNVEEDDGIAYDHFGNRAGGGSTGSSSAATLSGAAGYNNTKKPTIWVLGGEIFTPDVRSKFSCHRLAHSLRHGIPRVIPTRIFRQSRLLTYAWEVLNMIDLSAVMPAEDVLQMLASIVRSFFTKQKELEGIFFTVQVGSRRRISSQAQGSTSNSTKSTSLMAGFGSEQLLFGSSGSNAAGTPTPPQPSVGVTPAPESFASTLTLRRPVLEGVEAKCLQHLITFLVRVEKLRLVDTSSFYPHSSTDRFLITDPTQFSRHVIAVFVQQITQKLGHSVVELTQTPRELSSWVKGVSQKVLAPTVALEKLLTQWGLVVPLAEGLLVQLSQGMSAQQLQRQVHVLKQDGQLSGGAMVCVLHVEDFTTTASNLPPLSTLTIGSESAVAADASLPVMADAAVMEDDPESVSDSEPDSEDDSSDSDSTSVSDDSSESEDDAADGEVNPEKLRRREKKAKKREKKRLKKDKKKAKKKAKKLARKEKKLALRKQQKQQQKSTERALVSATPTSSSSSTSALVLYHVHSLTPVSWCDSESYLLQGHAHPLRHAVRGAQRCLSRVFRLDRPELFLAQVPGVQTALHTAIASSIPRQTAIAFYRDGLRVVFHWSGSAESAAAARRDTADSVESASEDEPVRDLVQILVVPHLVPRRTLCASPVDLLHASYRPDTAAATASTSTAKPKPVWMQALQDPANQQLVQRLSAAAPGSAKEIFAAQAWEHDPAHKSAKHRQPASRVNASAGSGRSSRSGASDRDAEDEDDAALDSAPSSDSEEDEDDDVDSSAGAADSDELCLGFEVHLSTQIPYQPSRAGGDVLSEVLQTIRGLLLGITAAQTPAAESNDDVDEDDEEAKFLGHRQALATTTCLRRLVREYVVHPLAPLARYGGVRADKQQQQQQKEESKLKQLWTVEAGELMHFSQQLDGAVSTADSSEAAVQKEVLEAVWGLSPTAKATESATSLELHRSLRLGLAPDLVVTVSAPVSSSLTAPTPAAAPSTPSSTTSSSSSSKQDAWSLLDVARMTLVSSFSSSSASTVSSSTEADSERLTFCSVSEQRALIALVLTLIRTQRLPMYALPPVTSDQSTSSTASSPIPSLTHAQMHAALLEVQRMRTQLLLPPELSSNDAPVQRRVWEVSSALELPYLPLISQVTGDAAAASSSSGVREFRLSFLCPLCLTVSRSGPSYVLRIRTAQTTPTVTSSAAEQLPSAGYSLQWDADVLAALETTVRVWERVWRMHPRLWATAQLGAQLQDTLDVLNNFYQETLQQLVTQGASDEQTKQLVTQMLGRAQRMFRLQQRLLQTVQRAISRPAATASEVDSGMKWDEVWATFSTLGASTGDNSVERQRDRLRARWQTESGTVLEAEDDDSDATGSGAWSIGVPDEDDDDQDDRWAPLCVPCQNTSASASAADGVFKASALRGLRKLLLSTGDDLLLSSGLYRISGLDAAPKRRHKSRRQQQLAPAHLGVYVCPSPAVLNGGAGNGQGAKGWSSVWKSLAVDEEEDKGVGGSGQLFALGQSTPPTSSNPQAGSVCAQEWSRRGVKSLVLRPDA